MTATPDPSSRRSMIRSLPTVATVLLGVVLLGLALRRGMGCLLHADGPGLAGSGGMTHDPIPRGETGALVVAAARCWRAARDTGAPVQQALHTLLSPQDRGMLAPMFDSLLALCEAALGRRVAVGSGAVPSGDERLLADLLDGTRSRRACFDCAEGTASALDCALCSARIMLGLSQRLTMSPGR